MWARILSAGLGIWLMAAPAILGYGGAARANHLIAGPLAASVAIIAIWEVTRALRWANLPLGLWLIVAPLFFSMAAPAAINSLVAGALLAALALFGGRVSQRFGGGWRSVIQSTSRQ
jgi:hypothetical protein